MKNRNLGLNGIMLLFIIIFMGSISCTDAGHSMIDENNDEYKVEMINCDGTVAREWISSSRAKSEPNRDSYHFIDKKTGEFIEVTGRIVITKQ